MGYQRNISSETHPRGGRVYRVRKMVDGVLHKRSFSRLDDAKMYVRSLEVGPPGTAAPRRHTLREVVDQYLARSRTLGRSAVTLRDYEQVTDQLLKLLGESRRTVNINDQDILRYIERRKETASDNRILRELRLLRTMVSTIAGDGALRWALPAIQPKRRQRELPVDDDVRAAFQALQRPDLERGYLLGLLTAMRASDILRACSDWRRGDVLHIPMSKRRGEVNVVPIVATLAAAVDQVDGRYLEVSESALRSALQRRGLTKGLGHLRHVCATWCAQAGYPDTDIGLLLGHAGKSVTRRHYINDEGIDRKRKMLEAVEQRFAGYNSGTNGVQSISENKIKRNVLKNGSDM